MDSIVLNTDLSSGSSVATPLAPKPSRKLPNLDLQCYVGDKSERKINYYTKHAVAHSRSHRKVSKRMLPLVSPTLDDQFIVTSPRAEVEDAADTEELGLNNDYLDSEETPRRSLTPGAYIRDMVERFDYPSLNTAEVKTVSSFSQDNSKGITKKFLAENACLTFNCDGPKNISQRVRSQSETVGNTDKMINHSRSTKPTTAPKPKFYLKNKFLVANCEAESLGSSLTKSNSDQDYSLGIANPSDSVYTDKSTTSTTSLSNSVSLSIHDDAKLGQDVSGCNVQELCTAATEADISSGPKRLGDGHEVDDGDWEDIETSETVQKQTKKKPKNRRVGFSGSSSSSVKKLAFKKSLNEKVIRVPSSREGSTTPLKVIYINEKESEKDKAAAVCNSDHSVSAVALDAELNKLLVEGMRSSPRSEESNCPLSDQQLPMTNDRDPSDIRLQDAASSDSDELMYEILPFPFNDKRVLSSDHKEPMYELSSTPEGSGASTPSVVSNNTSSVQPRALVPQVPARPSMNPGVPSPIGSPAPAPRKISKGHLDVSKLTQVVLPPSPVTNRSIGSSPIPPVTLPRVPPRQSVSTPSTPVPAVLPRKRSDAQTAPNTRSRRLPPMPPPVPESAVLNTDVPTVPADVPVLPQRSVRQQSTVSIDRVAASRTAHKRPSVGTLKGYEDKCVEVDSGNPSKLNSKSMLSIATSQSMNDLLRTTGSRGSTLSLHVPPPSLNGADGNQPISPSRSEGYLKQSSDGYLPMGSQRGSAISSRISLISESLEQNVAITSNGFPIIPPRNNLHRFSSAANSQDGYETKTQNLEKIVRRDNSYLELSQDDDYAKYAYLTLYAECEPYQIYHQTAVVRQVIEQNMDTDSDDYDNYYSPQEYVEHAKSCVNDILKRDSGNELLDSKKVIRGLSTLESAARLGTGFRKLWCEMPKVRESGLLDHMTPDERRLQESSFEILSSEASYLKSLNLLVGHFMGMLAIDIEDKDKHPVLTKQDFIWLFSNAKAVRDACIKMLEALENLWQDGCVINPLRLCRTITEVVQEHYSVYVTYCSNASYQERKLRELNEKSAEFRYAVRRLEDSADCHSLPLHSFIALPMQRITRMPLLVSAMCRYLRPDDAASPEVTRCIQTLQKVVKQCNEGARKMSNLEQMSKIEKVLDFRSVKKVPIISQSRFLVKKGFLVHIINQPSGFLKKSRRTLFFFLFNDLLIITKKKSEKQYEVLEHCSRSRIHTETIRDEDVQRFLPYGAPSGCRNLFNMVLIDKGVEFVLSCESQSEQQRWIQAVTPVEHAAGEDVIYMDWDCPQVQAVMQYVATEPDELSLEESDIVNVLCKETDGWYEGERIRDGERGWFPAHCTVEIQNEHVRARNLRQQYQLMKKSTNTLQ